MILTHPRFERPLICESSSGTLLVVESPALMQRLLKELLNQTEGIEGNFVLAEGGRQLPLEKFVHLIVNPLELEHNPRKAVNTLYKQLDESLLSEETAQRLDELLGQMKECLQLALPDSYAELEPINVPDWDATLKFFEVSFRSQFSGLTEELTEYFKMMHHYCGYRVFVCLNLLSFLEIRQLKQLFTEAAYHEYNILAIESHIRDYQNAVESPILIMDKDECEI